MYPRRPLRSAALILAFAAVAGCGSSEFETGPKRTDHRQVGSFDSIDLDGSARLLVTVGDSRSVSVEAPESVIERVTTEVDGSTLHIRTRAKDWVWMNGRPRIEISVSVPELKSLKLEGGNDVRLKGFKGGETRIAVQGAAHVRAAGEVDALSVDMQGAGFADLSDLVAAAATVSVDGVGKVIVHSKNKLDATINGIGSILYTGSPHDVSTRMNGLGSIVQQGEHQSDSKKQRREEHEWRKHRHEDMQDDEEEPARGRPEADPKDLQPEYDNRPDSNQKEVQPKKVVDMTKVVRLEEVNRSTGKLARNSAIERLPLRTSGERRSSPIRKRATSIPAHSSIFAPRPRSCDRCRQLSTDRRGGRSTASCLRSFREIQVNSCWQAWSLTALLYVASPAIPAAAAAEEPAAQLSIEDLKARLSLTPEQQEKIAPLAEERRAKLEGIRGKLSSAASRQDKRAVLQDAKAIQDDFASKVEPLLTAEQKTEWTRMRAEARSKMIERWRSNR